MSVAKINGGGFPQRTTVYNHHNNSKTDSIYSAFERVARTGAQYVKVFVQSTDVCTEVYKG